MAENSTNVRAEWLERGARGLGWGLSAVAPGVAAMLAERLFMTPRRTRRSRSADAVLAQGQQRMLEVCGEQVALWSWGVGPRVLLVHGWSGYGGQLTAFVKPLLAAGFSVVTFDAPAHGVSSGRYSSIPGMAKVITAVARATGGPFGVVAHSMGAAATALAMRDGLKVERAVFIAPPVDPRRAVEYFSKRLGLSRGVSARMTARVEKRAGRRVQELTVTNFAPLLHVPLHVFHDVEDREVSLEAGESVARAWPGARLTRTKGLGHYRILYAPEVLSEAVRFLSEGRESDALPGAEWLAAGERHGRTSLRMAQNG